ncbi:FtsX-like permease family protein [Pimelobacter simplex]|uniref:FtsX-like permease family protein n=1 Tax=Nocardioides simplex TaxID=2045 RepID=UPI002150142E|nr:ABC transporter permease [Pimelobacter simplex]UUW90792.1 ABC transporter permease [Pimelobacter simplex]UUW94621.1 ABC transporter permease [Pimelobacter simplex]
MSATGSSLGGWRVALRLARREAWRRKGQTLLMLVLICGPVMAVSAATVVWRTSDVSSAESVTRVMGGAEALLTPQQTRDVAQEFDPADGTSWGADNETPATEAEIRTVLGERPLLPVRHESSDYRTDHGIAGTNLLVVDLRHPLAEGLFRLAEGRFPRAKDEVVVNAALADRGPGLGEKLVLEQRAPDGTKVPRELRIVGVGDYADSRTRAWAGVLPGAVGEPTADDGPPDLLVGGAPVTWSDVLRLNELGVLVASRQVLTDPPPESALAPDMRGGDDGDNTALTVLGLVVAMVLLEVVLLAGPAFAVRARAQAHTLALVAASGGTPAQARRTVLASGVVVGLIGGVLGVVLGIAGSTLAIPIAQRLDAAWFGPFEVPWALLALVAGFGFVSAVLAAVVPAFAASRQDVVAVLAGRRGEGRPSRRSPVVGLVLIGLGVAGSVVGSRPGGGSSALLVGASAIISVVGMIFLVPVVVAGLARLAARLPLPLRFAARDAARHRMRTVPAIAAVGATVAGVIALGIAVSSQAASDEQGYAPMLPIGYGAVPLPTDATPANVDEVEEILRKGLPDAPRERVTGVVMDSEEHSLDIGLAHGDQRVNTSYLGMLGTSYVVADGLPDYLGTRSDDRAAADRVLADGGIVVLRNRNENALPADRLTVEVGEVPFGGGEITNLRKADLPAVAARVPERSSPVAAVLSPAAAEKLRLPTATTAFAVRPTIERAALKNVNEQLAASPANVELQVERGYQPDAATQIIKLVLAVLGGILMLGGTLTATFLALSDARPDFATMAAVGARPRTRRGVAASYALVVGLVGALLGAPIGFIPGVAISRPLTYDDATSSTLLEIPWPLLGAVVLGLPLLTALIVGAAARSRLPLAARVD